ncbi:MAG: OsmC family protein [Acidobacteria bacterium]|nr:OsmC family protein [Acidobacteriota bacterium]
MATEVVGANDMLEPIIRKKTVAVSNDGSMMAIHDYGEFGTTVTDEPIAHGGSSEGPSPLQAVLGALCGCESVTFNRTASEMDFAYDGIEFEAEFTIDIRGRMGQRGVRQHFQTVRVEAIVTTDENEERFTEVVEETEARCPVFNLLTDAGVNMKVRWVRQPTSA